MADNNRIINRVLLFIIFQVTTIKSEKKRGKEIERIEIVIGKEREKGIGITRTIEIEVSAKKSISLSTGFLFFFYIFLLKG